MRRGHWLKPNAKTVIPHFHLCVATSIAPIAGEPDNHALVEVRWSQLLWDKGKLEVAMSGQGNHPDHFWDWCDEELTATPTTWIWFNKPEQDLPALLFTDLVHAGDFVRQYWVWGNPPVIVVGKLFGKSVKIVSPTNFLEDVVEDYETIHPPASAITTLDDGTDLGLHSRARWDLVRCRQAVTSILTFVHREDLGHLRTTIGGQSLQAYRHLHLPGKIGVHDNVQALHLERECPLGIPIECPRTGQIPGPIYVVDVNAIYPYVMANYPYPRKLLWYSEFDDVEQLQKTAETHLLIARVTGYDEDSQYLVKRGHAYEWSNSLLCDVLAGPDLDRALTRGKIKHVHQCAAYEGAGVFASWGLWAWELRQRYKERGDRLESCVAKALTVALWGQFAARLERWVPYPDHPPLTTEYGIFWDHKLNGDKIRCRAIAGVVDRFETREEPDNSMPAISAFVAAYARMYMTNLTRFLDPADIVYQSADAVHVTAKGYQRFCSLGLVEADCFGGLKLDHVAKEVFIEAPNVYCHDGLWKYAGRHQAAYQTGPTTWQWESPDRLSSAVLRPMDGRVRMNRHQVAVESASVPEPPAMP